MDVQRFLLIGAIAVLSFMLLTEWVAFKEEQIAANAPVAERLTGQNGNGSAASPALETPDLPVAEPEQSTADELPVDPVTAQAENQVAPGDASPGRIIEITTDTLQLAVDLQGGDIIEVALSQYLEQLNQPEPFVLLENNSRRVYVAQSGLIGPNGIDRGGRAQFSTSQMHYELPAGENTMQVDLHWSGDNGVEVIKRFTLTRGDYLVKVSYLVTNNSDARWQGNMFGQIKRDSSADPSASTSGMGLAPFLGAALTQPEENFTKFNFDDMREEPFKGQIQGGWIAMVQHYFLSAWVPGAEQLNTYSTRVSRSGFNIAGYTSPALVLDPGNSGTLSAGFYAGPKDQYRLEEISPYLDLTVDYGWLWWIAQPLFWLLNKIHGLVGNWGVAIILLTVLVKAAFFQLSATSYRSMANMRRVQPQLVALREQYANDKQKQSQAMMDLYRKEKVNPMGGCLPILVQMPVFIALYWVLMESVELRHAPFALWIHDLSVMDPYFVLPLLMGASMWFMQRLNPAPPDPMQAKIMQWMPVMFTFFFLWFPAGLVLYWLVNNLLSMAQQWYITRKIEKGAKATA